MTTAITKMMVYSKRPNPLEKHMEEKAHQYTSKDLKNKKIFLYKRLLKTHHLIQDYGLKLIKQESSADSNSKHSSCVYVMSPNRTAVVIK